MAFSISNVVGISYSGWGTSKTLTIPASTIGDIAIIITTNGNSEDNTSYTPVVPGDFIRVGRATAGRAVYTKHLTASDMNRTISIAGGSSWGYIYFTIPHGYRLMGVISTTGTTINYNSGGKPVAIISDLNTSANDNGYTCINNSYSSEVLYMKEFTANTVFSVPQGTGFHNTNYPHLIFQKSDHSIYDVYTYGSLGNLNFYTPYGDVTMYGTNSGYGNHQTASDVLAGKNYLYVMDCNMNMVYVYNKNVDGTFGFKYKNVNWYSQDNIIDQIQRCNSSVPTAYALFVENGQDKLVGWSYASATLYVWDIIDGNISNRVSYPAPSTMTYYSRGGWDGGNYVYFVNIGNNILYRWDIMSKNTPVAVVTLASYSSYVSSSFTGSGLFVDTSVNEVYAGSGADQNNGFLSCWDLTTGAFKGKITDAYQLGATPLNGTTGTVIMNPLNRGVAYYLAMYQQNITQLRLSSRYSNRYRRRQYNFQYTGDVQVFVAPYSGTYTLECWGAEGGTGTSFPNEHAGLGGYSKGKIHLVKGQVVYVYVGGKGGPGPAGGWNGGGKGGDSGHTGGGGGATDIRTANGEWHANLNARIIVAGGGGGQEHCWGGNGYTNYSGHYGEGGGLEGLPGLSNQTTGYGTGGTQTAAGHNLYGNGTAYGGFGYGGDGNTISTCASGGGGGWYGGGGAYGGNAGGGSGYIGSLQEGFTSAGGHYGHGFATITSEYYGLNSSISLLIDGKYYIPNKLFFDIEKDEFIPVTLDFLKDFKNNYYKFVYNINKLNKRIYYHDINFLPFEKLNMKNAKIFRIDYDSIDLDFDTDFLDSLYYLEDDYDYIYEPKNITFKYNTSIYNLNNSIIKVEGFSQEDNYSYNFVDIGLNPNVKVLIKNRDKYYGTDLKETTLDKILTDGIDGTDFKSYRIKFLKFDIYIAFKNRCYDDSDKVNKINFHSKEFQNMKNLKEADDYNVLYDAKKDSIYVKFNKNFSNVLLKKLENAEIEDESTMDEF